MKTSDEKSTQKYAKGRTREHMANGKRNSFGNKEEDNNKE